MPTLPKVVDASLLVRTNFDSDEAWANLIEAAQRVSPEGFRAYVEPVSDPAFDGADWETVRAAVPADDNGALVLFIADEIALVTPHQPVLAVDLRLAVDLSQQDDATPFRCVAAELWAVENNLNIANLDWQDFADATDEDGVYRGFSG